MQKGLVAVRKRLLAARHTTVVIRISPLPFSRPAFYLHGFKTSNLSECEEICLKRLPSKTEPRCRNSRSCFAKLQYHLLWPSPASPHTSLSAGRSTGKPSTTAVFSAGTTPFSYATRRQNQCERTTWETCSIGTPLVCRAHQWASLRCVQPLLWSKTALAIWYLTRKPGSWGGCHGQYLWNQEDDDDDGDAMNYPKK